MARISGFEHACHATQKLKKATHIKREPAQGPGPHLEIQSGNYFTETFHQQIRERIKMNMAGTEEYEDDLSEWDMDEEEAQNIHEWITRHVMPFETLIGTHLDDTLASSAGPKRRRPPRIVYGDSRYKRKAKLRRKMREEASLARIIDSLSSSIKTEGNSSGLVKSFGLVPPKSKF